MKHSYRESRWHTGRPDVAVPADVADWLFDQGSLTAKLVSACKHGHFSVEVVRQQWGRPFNSERKLLAMRDGEMALVREVRLRCGDQAWVFARTLIPASSFRGRARRLAFLGNRPLGALLFADPATRRRVMQVSYLQSGQRLFDLAMQNQSDFMGKGIWGRRTLFEYAGKPLLVNEIFLPALTGQS
jgi:chorismate--pyruvate lyase